MGGVTYDTGALVAAERGDRAVWAIHKRALERKARPIVPAGVLAEGWRTGRQVNLSRLLAGCRVEDLTEVRARASGAACARARTDDPIDASVVVGAVARGDLVLSSDPGDLQAIAGALGHRVNVRRV
jgi:hypothetical protein